MLRQAVAILLGVILLSCGSANGGNKAGFTLNGTISVTDFDSSWTPGQQCNGERSYSDLFVGQDVPVQDDSGNVLVTGHLTDSAPGEGSESSTCYFRFEVNGVPRADSYIVFVGDRGPFSYTFVEMDEREQWSVTYAFGD